MLSKFKRENINCTFPGCEAKGFKTREDLFKHYARQHETQRQTMLGEMTVKELQRLELLREKIEGASEPMTAEEVSEYYGLVKRKNGAY